MSKFPTSPYLLAKAKLEADKCTTCGGLGVEDDADCNDIQYNIWQCTACGGTGFAPEVKTNANR